MIRGGPHIRRFCSSKGKSFSQWPFIERKSLSASLIDAIDSVKPKLTFVNGGIGSGKTEAIRRVIDKYVHQTSDRKHLIIVLDFDTCKTMRSIEEVNQMENDIVRLIAEQISLQLEPSRVFSLLYDHCPDFEDRLKSHISQKPLRKHLTRSCKSLKESWVRIMTSQSVVAEALPKIRLSDDVEKELDLYMNILRSTGCPITLCLLHIDRFPSFNTLKGVLFNPSFNVIVECNDPLTSIWTVCGEDFREWDIIEVNDLTKEAIQSVFVPSLLSDTVHVDTLLKVCGGRVGLLEKFFVPLTTLREQQKLKDMEQEQRYRAGKENRPSSESKELQVDPLLFQRDVIIRDSLVDGVLNGHSLQFQDTMERFVNESAAMENLRESFSPMEFKVFVIESVQLIVDKLNTQGCMPLPASMSPLDIAHPAVLGLMECGLLMMRWVPYPRIVEAYPATLIQLDAWCSSQLEGLNIQDRTYYNVVAMRNRIHLEKQLDKLSR